MNFIALAVACVILVAGAFVGKREITEFTQKTKNVSEQDTDVLSIEDEDENATESPTLTVSPTPTRGNTPSATTAPYLTPTTKPLDLSGDLKSYVYNGSQVVSETSTEVHLSSTANVDTITNWYKDKIRSEGMNVKNFVTTKANDKVLNKLTGVNGQKEIAVEIKKESKDASVFITVTITMKNQRS